MLSFLIILAALVVGSVVFFRADTILVSGNSRYSAEEIIQAAGVEYNENLFRVNRRLTLRRILDALPYVRDVSIQRALPDTLILSVTETTAVAQLAWEGGHFLLDARGKVLERRSSPDAQLPALTGLSPLSPEVGAMLAVEEGDAPRLSGLTGLLTALEEAGLTGHVTFVDLSSASDILIGYTDRFTVQFPLSCDFPYKVRSLEYVISQLEDNETGLLDLTRAGETHFIPQ